MSDHGGPPTRLPTSAWVLGWSSLAGQVTLLADSGLRLDDEVSVFVSMALGGLLIGWIAAGVLRARTGRVVVAYVVLVLSLLVGIGRVTAVGSVSEAALPLLGLVVSVVQVSALLRFRRTDWYAWQRTRPPGAEGPSIGQLVAIGVTVGVLGGPVAPVDDGFRAQLDVTEGGPTGQLRR